MRTTPTRLQDKPAPQVAAGVQRALREVRDVASSPPGGRRAAGCGHGQRRIPLKRCRKRLIINAGRWRRADPWKQIRILVPADSPRAECQVKYGRERNPYGPEDRAIRRVGERSQGPPAGHSAGRGRGGIPGVSGSRCCQMSRARTRPRSSRVRSAIRSVPWGRARPALRAWWTRGATRAHRPRA